MKQSKKIIHENIKTQSEIIVFTEDRKLQLEIEKLNEELNELKKK